MGNREPEGLTITSRIDILSAEKVSEARRESVNGFIGRAISETMKRDSGDPAACGGDIT